MARTHPSELPAAHAYAGRTGRLRGLTWTHAALGAILVLAAILRLVNIDTIGQANTYYTAAIESMLQSWHNFFFVAAEPGGSVSLDKPPLGFWLQALSAAVLGVNGFAVVLPQILAGIASVALLFHLVRRSFGDVPGLYAALTLAVTPVAVAIDRNNTPDATLILALLLAAWGFIKATETDHLRYLLFGAVMIGVGFNIKMMQALLPVPAMYAAYLFGASQAWRRKLANLAVATLVLVPVALSWATIVELTPADQRPYVGGSTNNSVYNLIFGYNGIERLTGTGTGLPVGAGNRPPLPALPGGPDAGARPTFPGDGSPAGLPGDAGGASGMFGTGQPGLLRMFQAGLAAQVSWLLPFGLLTIVLIAGSMAWRRPHTAYHRGLLLWGGWLLTCVAFFSAASFFHQYYLAMLAPPLAALVAIGIAFLWRLQQTHAARAALLLIVAAGATLAFQLYAAGMYVPLSAWALVPVILGAGGAILLAVGWRRQRPWLPRAGFALVVVALLVVPAGWSALTSTSSDSRLPTAYTGTVSPGGLASARPPGAVPTAAQQSMRDYLLANTRDTTYLVVVPSSQVGADLVLATGRPVLYAGGFNGSDQVIAGEDLARLVATGEVRYVLWGSGAQDASITSYLATACTVVTDAGLDTESAGRRTDGPRGGIGQLVLYRCGDAP